MIATDRAQTAAAEQFTRDGAWVSVLVIAEALWVLESTYRFRTSQIEDTVSSMLENPSLFLENAAAVEDALDPFRSRPGARLFGLPDRRSRP